MSKVGESENDPQDNDLHRHTLISKIRLMDGLNSLNRVLPSLNILIVKEIHKKKESLCSIFNVYIKDC